MDSKCAKIFPDRKVDILFYHTTKAKWLAVSCPFCSRASVNVHRPCNMSFFIPYQNRMHSSLSFQISMSTLSPHPPSNPKVCPSPGISIAMVLFRNNRMIFWQMGLLWPIKKLLQRTNCICFARWVAPFTQDLSHWLLSTFSCCLAIMCIVQNKYKMPALMLWCKEACWNTKLLDMMVASGCIFWNATK